METGIAAATLEESAPRPGAPAFPAFAFAAALLIMFALGAFYSWSVFVRPLERALGAGRGEVSLAYSIATVGFTAGMLVGPRLFGRFGTPTLALAACLIAGSGLAITAWASTTALAILGFGGVFATANGVGYGLALEVAQRANPGRRGLAGGLAVAVFMAGSVVLAPAAAYGIERVGHAWTLTLMGAGVALVGAAAGRLLALSRLEVAPGAERGSAGGGRRRTFVLLWLGLLLGSTAGVMALGHAAAIVTSLGGGAAAAALGATLIAFGSGVGRLAGGWLSDKAPPPLIIAGAQALGAAALLLPLLRPEAHVGVAALALVGGSYGALVGAFPPTIAQLYGAERAARVYGRVFTAWGVAGLGGSYLAGLLFDVTGAYDAALVMAALTAVAAAAVAMLLPNPDRLSDRSSRDDASA